MAWLAVNKNKDEVILGNWKLPTKDFKNGVWISLYEFNNYYWNNSIKLPKGTIKKLIGKELTWNDKPIELK